MNKHSALTQAAEHREMEVFNHQINIDNYRLAIEEIESSHFDKPYMVEFADRLKELLQSSMQEQEKEKVLLKVIRKQLDDC